MGKTRIREKNVVDSDFVSEMELQEKIGVANGIPPLDSNVKIPCEYLYDCGGTGGIRTVTREEISNTYSNSVVEIIYITDIDNFVYSKSIDSNQWYDLRTQQIIRSTISGTGDIGTWYEKFNTTLSDVWYGDIGDRDDGTTAGKWNRHTGSTPSVGTGPSGSSDDEAGYIYVEVSNNGHTAVPRLHTKNFAVLDTLSFKYHINGRNSGTLNVIFINSLSDEEIVWSVSGSQGDAWHEVTINVADYHPSEVVFEYRDATGWQGDCALDEIIFTSIG